MIRSTATVRRARTAHLCDVCRREIPAGQNYTHRQLFRLGPPAGWDSERTCPQCEPLGPQHETLCTYTTADGRCTLTAAHDPEPHSIPTGLF